MSSEQAFENQFGQIIPPIVWFSFTLGPKLELLNGTTPSIRHSEGSAKASFRGALAVKSGETVKTTDIILTTTNLFFPSEKRIVGGITDLIEITSLGEMFIVEGTITAGKIIGLDNISYWL